MSMPSSLLPELPALLVIAEECHFGRAAERLNVSQPRVSQIVRRIEDIVGYKIFFRRPGIRLTPAGKLLTKAAGQALDELSRGLARAEHAATGRSGLVRLGYAPVAMLTRLPRILKSFRARNPEVELQLHTTHLANLWTGFDTHRYDLIISREAYYRSGVNNHLFARDGLVAVLPEGDPLANGQALPIAALAGREFIASEDAIAPQWHQMIAAMCQAAGFEPRITQRTNDWGAMLALVASGMGISIVSSTLAQLSFPGVEFIPLKDAESASSFWLACHEKSKDQAVDVLLSELIAPERT